MLTPRKQRTAEAKFDVRLIQADIDALVKASLYHDDPKSVLFALLVRANRTSRREMAYARGLLEASLHPLRERP